MKTTFYIVRHGRTMFNEKGLVQGWSDSPLIEEGIQQAKQLHEGLKDIPFDLGISSTSERASDTLDYILQGRCPTKLYKGLKETGFGTMEGDSVHSSFPGGFIDPSGYPQQGGEPMEEALERFIATLKEVIEEWEGKTILLVSHGNILCGLFRELDEEFNSRTEYPGVLVPNCSVSVATYEDGMFLLEQWPDISYREKVES